MAGLQLIGLKGVRSQEDDQLIPIDHAVLAMDCHLDDGTITGRNGYTAATASWAGTGLAQVAARFRPQPPSFAPNDVRTVQAQAGTISLVSDPTSEVLKNGAVTSLGALFGTTDNLSMAQLGKYLYIGTDQSNNWYRISPSFVATPIVALTQPNAPTFTVSSLAIQQVTGLSAPTLSNCTTTPVFSNGWNEITASTASNYAEYSYASPQNWTAFTWLAVMVCCPSLSSGDAQVTISLSTATGSLETIGTSYDGALGPGSTCIIYCPLENVSAATMAAVSNVTFSINNHVSYLVYGWMPMCTAPQPGPAEYNVTLYNSTSLEESVPSTDVLVTYSENSIVLPEFPAVQMFGSTFGAYGTISTDPDSSSARYCCNKDIGLALPTRASLTGIPTFSGAIPTGDQYPAADTVHLWLNTATGWRLVNYNGLLTPPTQTFGAGITTYSITDNQGINTLTHPLYDAGGTPPPCMCLCASAGRLVAAGDPNNPNRVSVSSYVAFTTSSDPIAEFPQLGILDSDGWAFDLGDNAAEQVLWCGYLDTTYLGTNEGMYIMPDLRPNGLPTRIFNKGVVSRHSACFAEASVESWYGTQNAVMWGALDGVFYCRNRTFCQELTKTVRRTYQSWLIPGPTTWMAYHKRNLLVGTGNRMMRYDFVSETWTQATLADSIVMALTWVDQASLTPQCWLLAASGKLMRWQPGVTVVDPNRATMDDTAPINSWVYTTGFDWEPNKARINDFYVDSTGQVAITAYKNIQGSPFRTQQYYGSASGLSDRQPDFAADFTSFRFQIQLTAPNSVRMLRVLWERTKVDAHGAS